MLDTVLYSTNKLFEYGNDIINLEEEVRSRGIEDENVILFTT